MNTFLCALRPTGQPVQKSDLFAYLARLPRDVEYETVMEGGFAAVVATGSRTMRPLSGRYRHLVGVGDVRLENRAAVLRLSGGVCDTGSDLQLVLAAIDAHGTEIVKELHGEFAFVAWDARAQKVIAARDAFGVKSLFMRREGSLVVFSSRSAPLGRDEYDTDFLRDFLYGIPVLDERTVWKQVQRLQPGTVWQQRGTAGTIHNYWSAANFEPRRTADEAESVQEFRTLFTAAVAGRIDAGKTWAQLSGGLDSSAIVSTAEHSVAAGSIDGTVTLVDSLADGDERVFSDCVVHQFGLRNEQIHDAWPWQHSHALAITDEPSALFPFQARDDRMRSAVTSGGGRVLLSGLGADHYLFGNLSYIPDLVAAGRLVSAARELAAWSYAGRQSFWKMARRHAVQPLLGRPSGVSVPQGTRHPAWLGNAAEYGRHFSRLYDFIGDAPRGRMFSYYTAREMQNVSAQVMRGSFEDGIEVRYPFLSRPLVEFTLQLPVNMRVRPFARKWILREAMRGILPEPVRTRTTKGSIDARIMWALQHEKPVISRLLDDSVLGDLGLIDVKELRGAVEQARCGEKHNMVMLMSALSLETWLAVRDGRFAAIRRAA